MTTAKAQLSSSTATLINWLAISPFAAASCSSVQLCPDKAMLLPCLSVFPHSTLPPRFASSMVPCQHVLETGRTGLGSNCVGGGRMKMPFSAASHTCSAPKVSSSWSCRVGGQRQVVPARNR